jgi:hypothetical protein
MTTFKLRRGTASDWTSKNPIMHEGEMGYETDTDKFKIGDGGTRWNLLKYYVDADGVQQIVDASLASVVLTGSPGPQGATGATGNTGPAGADGADGAPGVGVLVLGATDEVPTGTPSGTVIVRRST